MKRIIAAALAIAVVSMVSSCKPSAPAENKADSTAAPVEHPADSTAAADTTAAAPAAADTAAAPAAAAH